MAKFRHLRNRDVPVYPYAFRFLGKISDNSEIVAEILTAPLWVLIQIES